MIKLRTLLLRKYPYLLLLGITLLFCILRLAWPSSSLYQEGEVTILGRVDAFRVDGASLRLEIRTKETIIAHHYFKSKEEKETFLSQIAFGDQWKLTGTLKKLSKNTIPFGFSFSEDGRRNGQFFSMELITYEKVKSSSNLLLIIRNFVYRRLSSQTKTNAYLRAFLLGDTFFLEDEVKKSYQVNGISHLFAISGMHIGLFSSVLLKLLQKCGCKEKLRNFLVMLFLLFYLLLTGIRPSILRAVLFFFFFSLNDIYYFYVDSKCIFLCALCIVLWINPYFLFDLGFQFSFLISFFLLSFQTWIRSSKNYFISLLRVSFLSFFSSLPICLLAFSEVNVLSIFYNLFFVPFVSFVVFPFSWLTFFFPFLSSIFALFLFFLEQSSLFFAQFHSAQLIFGRPSIFFVIIYILFFYFGMWKALKKNFFLLCLCLLLLVFQYCLPFFFKEEKMWMLDVGQGDSLLFTSENNVVLVDTGGKMDYEREAWQKQQHSYSIAERKTLPFLKAKGIRKIDALILTHGDADHMKEAEIIVQSFPVKRVILNEGDFNSLEMKLLTLLKRKKIPYEIGKQGMTYFFGNLSFYSINRDLKEENDSSLVFLVTNGKYKILLTGDASIYSEKTILSAYSLPYVDILKVGHHGSKTSTSEALLQTIQPRIALISAGQDNQFQHPHTLVLHRLQKYQIKTYVTSHDGSVEVDLKNGTLLTYPP